MKVNEIEMICLINGKCLPRDIRVNESVPAYLVRQINTMRERAEAAEATVHKLGSRRVALPRPAEVGNCYMLDASEVFKAMDDADIPYRTQK